MSGREGAYVFEGTGEFVVSKVRVGQRVGKGHNPATKT